MTSSRPRKVTLKEETPLLRSRDMQQRLSVIPMTKEELLNYLRKKQRVDKIDPKAFSGHTFFGGIKELIDDVNYFKQKKKKCRQISELCKDTTKDLQDVLKDFDI